MKFIEKDTELRSSFKSLITQYNRCCICVAWASQDSEVMELLDEYHSKVKKMIVGLDFCQTDYKFIVDHLSNSAIRYFTDEHKGVFHPKMYLFYDDDKHWRAIVGSANLTYNGFSVNQEACMIVGDEDNGSKATFQAMLDFVNKLWERSSKLTAEDMANYKAKHHEQLKANKSANIGFKPWLLKKAIIDNMTWDEYISKLKNKHNEFSESVEIRLKLLKRSQSLFASVKQFNSLSDPDRACIAGFKRYFIDNHDNIDCFFFGYTTRVTYFTKSIKNRDKLSKAIDVIPLEGEITSYMYEDYCSYFDGHNSIACPTRLLAIKRPDVFVSINNMNKKWLCNDFGISPYKLNLKNYWDLIICRIQGSKWYNDHRKLEGEEKTIKKFQVAMLDSIYYRK